MKRALLSFILTTLLSSIAYTQLTTSSIFNDSTYTQISRGIDPENPLNRYSVSFRSDLDATYTLKKVYLDSAFTKLLTKSFYKSDTLEGPFTIYQDTLIAFQGNYKNGRWDGERKTFMKGQLRTKSYFVNGIKTGTWEEYDIKGVLRRKIVYDANGNVSSDIKF